MQDQTRKESSEKKEIDALQTTERQEQKNERLHLHRLGFIMATRRMSQNDLISRRISQ